MEASIQFPPSGSPVDGIAEAEAASALEAESEGEGSIQLPESLAGEEAAGEPDEAVPLEGAGMLELPAGELPLAAEEDGLDMSGASRATDVGLAAGAEEDPVAETIEAESLDPGERLGMLEALL